MLRNSLFIVMPVHIPELMIERMRVAAVQALLFQGFWLFHGLTNDFALLSCFVSSNSNEVCFLLSFQNEKKVKSSAIAKLKWWGEGDGATMISFNSFLCITT